MNKYILFFICFLPGMVLFSSRSAYNEKRPFMLIVNPGSPQSKKYLRDWSRPYSRRYIYNWSKSRRFILADDREPVVNKRASFISPFGSKILVNGLKRGNYYRMWIDFVSYKNIDETEIESILKIIAGNKESGYSLIDTLKFSDINKNYYTADIPVEISIWGHVEIEFLEYSSAPGNWGVWDIIISDRKRLPGRFMIKEPEPVEIKIIERISE